MSIRARILVVVALACVLPTSLLGALAVRRARASVKREALEGHLALARALGARLDETLQDTRRALRLAAGSWADAPATADRCVRRVRRELPVVRRVAVLGPDGARLGGDALEAFALEKANTYGGYVSDVFRAPDGTPLALLVVQARGRTGALAGFFAAELDLSFVDEVLRTARLGAGARLWVIDAGGTPIGMGDRGAPPLRAAVLDALATGDEGSLEAEGTLAVYRNLASYQTVRGVGWAILLEQPTAEAYALAQAAARDTLLVGAAVLVVALLAASILAGRLARPLRVLSDGVAHVAEKGGSPGDLPVSAPGEIGALARRFQDMARRVEEREKLHAALARSEKLATVGALAAGVAHEINNPLQTILGYAELLLEDKPADHPDRRGLTLVADESRRVQTIVRTLLDHARMDAGPAQREPVDVNALVERTVALVGPTVKTRAMQVATALGDDLPRPTGDARRLEQVLVNLAQNALHAMERGGTLTLRTCAQGAAVAIEVADTGPGIPAEQRAQIFEPFFTTKGAGVGTGLGLAIARQIVQDHGGRIEVDSELGKGSTFRVVLGS